MARTKKMRMRKRGGGPDKPRTPSPGPSRLAVRSFENLPPGWSKLGEWYIHDDGSVALLKPLFNPTLLPDNWYKFELPSDKPGMAKPVYMYYNEKLRKYSNPIGTDPTVRAPKELYYDIADELQKCIDAVGEQPHMEHGETLNQYKSRLNVIEYFKAMSACHKKNAWPEEGWQLKSFESTEAAKSFDSEVLKTLAHLLNNRCRRPLLRRRIRGRPEISCYKTP